jgi:hypothetical protein
LQATTILVCPIIVRVIIMVNVINVQVVAFFVQIIMDIVPNAKTDTFQDIIIAIALPIKLTMLVIIAPIARFIA